MNDIPVVCANRGAIPEVVGNAGFVLPIPSRFQTEGRLIPTSEEMAPWFAAIVSLWDDESLRDRVGVQLRERVRRYDYDATVAELEKVLANL